MNLYVAPNLFEGLRAFARPAAPQMFGSIPIYSSALFPHDANCRKCDGTGGGGEDATYCPSCVGGGGYTVRGVMTNGTELTVIRDLWRRKFDPTFPFVIPLRRVRGATSIAWPASVDTHAQRGDSTQIEAPSPMGSAVPPTAGDAQ